MGNWPRNTAVHRQTGISLRAFPVLLYHRVGPPRPGTHASLTISPAEFELHLDWLASHGYHATSMRQLPLVPATRKPVVITFDDAYQDVAHYALTALECRRFSATLFVVTGQLGGTNVWDQAEGSAPVPLMTAQEVAEWNRRGMEFGAHGRTHSDLTTLDAQRLEYEVAGSARDLADLLGAPPQCFAYPYGRYNMGVIELVRRNFALAFTVRPGRNRAADDPCRLCRNVVRPEEGLAALRFRAALGFYPPRVLRDWTSRLIRREHCARPAGAAPVKGACVPVHEKDS